jgi:hypothetical protein
LTSPPFFLPYLLYFCNSVLRIGTRFETRLRRLFFISFSSPPLPPSSTTPAMPLSSESSPSNDTAPLTRPRPRYFDPHRYSSGSGTSSQASTPELLPPHPAGLAWSPAGSTGSAHSLSAVSVHHPMFRLSSRLTASQLDSPFLGAGRPLSLGYQVRPAHHLPCLFISQAHHPCV